MKRIIFTLLALISGMAATFALPGDTTIVQTFTFDDGRTVSRVCEQEFEFPDGSVQYEKVLMYYTLKCNPATNPKCGEWDYLYNTELLKPVGTDPETYISWKLGAYITPYGGGINLGDGWTWVYDVTDYVHLLQGMVILKDCNFQELLDLKFVFIEGTPPRDVIDIKRIWDGGYDLKNFDTIVKDTTIALQPNEKQVKLRTMLTGHGWDNPTNCAEFCPNFHSLKVNGSTIRHWNIIQECSSNPLYPQGGTWIYDRAGWCPGMQGTTNEFELTEYITENITGDSINFDYDVEWNEHGWYNTFIYLVTYGEINQTDDVAAEMIIAPTNDYLQLRYNPTCGEPIVVIKNIGSNPLSNVDIEYGFADGKVYTYSWQGDLAFLEKDTVALPVPDWNEVTGNTGTFQFKLLNPNGQEDPTPYNNQLSSSFKMAPIITKNEVQVYFKTNNDYEETTWKLYDNLTGELLYENEPEMVANKVYTKNITLEDGSYRLSLYDTAGDGLSFWAYIPPYGNQTAGSAALKQRSNGIGGYSSVYTFQPEFGRFARYHFAINRYSVPLISGMNEKVVKDIMIFHNPAQSYLYVDMLAIHGKNLSAEVYDMLGKVVLTTSLAKLQVNKIKIEHLSSGIYVIVIKENNKPIYNKKIVIQSR
jgi:hypothetical protein